MILGIDPGLGESHCVLLAPCPGPTALRRYPLIAAFALATPEDAPLAPFLTTLRPAAVIVESARGVIAKGRSADPVLRNATMGGRLVEHARVFGVPVLTVPAFGTEQGWNWRGELGGVTTDEGVAHAVRRLLSGPLPTGKRGGHVTHYHDAAGIAAAALHRLQRDDGTYAPDLTAAWTTLSPLETATQQAVSTRRAARRTGRALQKRLA